MPCPAWRIPLSTLSTLEELRQKLRKENARQIPRELDLDSKGLPPPAWGIQGGVLNDERQKNMGIGLDTYQDCLHADFRRKWCSC